MAGEGYSRCSEETIRLWWRNYGRLTPVRVDSLTDVAAVVTVRAGLTEGWGTLYIDVDSIGPHTITGVGMIPFREPIDWRELPIATEADLVAEVERLAHRLVQADAFSGVVLLTRDGKPLLRRAFGLADREAQRVNTMDTPFELASVGKMFTAVAVAQLAEQGKLSLDASIGSLLPDYPAGQSGSEVTVHHLLTMSSGIPDLFRSPRYWAARAGIRTLSDYWPFFATAALEFPPGTQWSYSNSNFLLLGSLVERVAAVPFAAAVEQLCARSSLGLACGQVRGSVAHPPNTPAYVQWELHETETLDFPCQRGRVSSASVCLRFGLRIHLFARTSRGSCANGGLLMHRE